MYRRGPSRATPANVQCQKCLKRGHYSYECKASAHERPYIPRPSRTQQLLNPKLAPKLASDAPNTLEKKQGLADETLVKREAERARQRDLQGEGGEGDDSDHRQSADGERSVSCDSVSTISTRRGGSRDPRGSRSPRQRNYTPSPQREPFQPRSVRSQRGRESFSRSPEGTRGRAMPPGDARPQSSRRYSSSRSRSPDPRPVSNRYSRRSQSMSRSPPPRRFRSRSPQRMSGREKSPLRQNGRRPQADHRRGGSDRQSEWRPEQQQTRERSLSPFSKRLALTQAMNAGQ